MNSGKEHNSSEKLTSTLFKISNAINTTDNLNDLYKSIHKSLNHIIDAANFYIALYDKQADIISFPYHVDLQDGENGELPDKINVRQTSSLTNEVIQKGKPLFFKKKGIIARAKKMNLKVAGVPAELWLGVPLKTKNEVIGAIVIQSYNDPDIYEQKDMNLLIAVSDQVALAINRKLSEKAQKKSEKINEALFAISNSINTTINLNDLYKSIHKILNKIMDLSNFYIALYNKKKDSVTFPYNVDEKDSRDSFYMVENVSDPNSPSTTAWVIQSGQPLLIEGKDLAAHMNKLGKKSVGTPPAIWMGSPLKVKEKVIGVIATQSYTNPNLYNKKDLEIFNSVSDQVALAIERKRAQDAETEGKTINKVLFSISNAVNTTENLYELYKSIHTILGSIIDVTNFMIGIYDHEKDTISYPYYRDEIDDDYGEIQNVSKSGIIASEVITRAIPFFITREDAITRAKKIGADIVGKVAEQWLGIPLIIKREVIGVIVVQSYSNPELYSEKDVEILLSVSDQIAMTIDRKKGEEARKKSEGLNKTLFEISNAVNTTRNLEQLCDSIHNSLEKVVYVENFSLSLYDKKIDKLSLLYSCDSTLPTGTYLENASQTSSMVFEVIKKGHPLLLNEQGQKELVKQIGGDMIGVSAKSWLCVPLKVKNKAIGAVLTQDYTTEDCYKKEDIELLTLVSDQIALAIDRKRSQDELKNSEKLTRTLFKISNAVNTTSNLDALFKKIHEILAGIIDVTNFTIGIYDSVKDVMSYPYYVDETGDSYNEIQNASTSGMIASEVINLAKPFFITGDKILERAERIGARIVEAVPPEQWLGVPLRTKKGVIGVIVVQSYSNPKLYSQKDADILTSISDQIATAINKKQSEDAQKISEEINMVLFAISNAVNTTSALDELYKSIHTFLGRIIDLTNFIIGLYNKENNTIGFEYYIDQFDDLQDQSVMIGDRAIGADIIKSGKPLFLTEQDLIIRAKNNIGTLPKIWIGVPLKVDGKVIGYMATQSYTDPYLFDNKDLKLLSAVSDQVAIAIDRKRSEEALAKSKKQIENISNQTEQFSLTAASMISTKNPKDVFSKISRAIVQFSNFRRVAITYLTDKPPYHEILAYDGLYTKSIEKYKKAIIKPAFYDAFFKKGESIGQFSVFIQSLELKKAYNAELIIRNNQKAENSSPDSWRKDDMLFVKMLDLSGNLIGFISVDDPVSRKKPTDETVRPLEIFSSLVSQIISSTKSQEELKIAKNAAEASAESKSEFLANMSHEIRTPMNAIMGLTDLTLKTNLDLRQRDYLDKIKSSSTSLLGIINDILDFSKIDAGKMDIENIDFKLNDVMDSLSDMFSTKTAEKEIEFVISISNDIPSHLIGDPLRLRQTLINLTGNAVKFTKKGEIIVSVSPIEDKGDHVKLEFAVKDTGIGIPENRLHKLFNSFVQADGSTTRNFGGTGLGLSISKKLIELMGGDIKVTSKIGEGSTFSFHLTFNKKDETIKHTRIDEKLNGLKVLVVDDNEAARDIMYDTLSSFHFDVKTVDSGMESLEELIKSKNEGFPYKLVLLDLIMPGIDGLETARLIRKNHNIAKVPIIIMTAFGREEVMHQAKKAGANAFLMKPVKQSILLDTIMNIFDKKPFAQAPKIKGSDTSGEFPQLKGLNVLLVEDNKINQLVASRILENVDIKVTIASTGLEAVQILKKSKSDLVLMDIQMPVMDGYCATGEIRNKLNLNDLPIIAMTAHAMAGDKEKCINAGMNDYISKPIDPDLLYSKLVEYGTPDMINQSSSKKETPSNKVSSNLTNSPLTNLPDSLPGINIKDGISRFMGNTELYIKLLTEFIDDNKSSIEKINTLLQSKKTEDTLNFLHSIKGTAGNLSATGLHKSATELETFVKENARTDKILLDNFEKAFLEITNTLNKINEIVNINKSQNNEQDKSEFNQEEIIKNITLLYTKLLQNDIEALDVFNIVKNMMGKKVAKNEILVLDRAINNFDFEEAKTVLFRIANIFKINLEGMENG